MKKIEALIAPAALARVRESLSQLEIDEFVVFEVDHCDASAAHSVLSWGAEYQSDRITRLKLELVVADGQAPLVAGSILANAPATRMGKSQLTISPIDQVIMISPQEQRRQMRAGEARPASA